MTKTLSFLAALLFALSAGAQNQQNQRMYSQPELDQMLAPVALYPDALLSQVLMAATYPDEVAEAANWSRANPGLQGDEAVRAVQLEDWDPSVKSLAAFPQVLQRMAENPQWTQALGEAFLAQEPHVMDSVQQLRRRAQAAGNLQSSEQLYVQQQGQTILIQPASPQYVYVPYYDPQVVYGNWWWPAYQPVVWAPWPGYARPYRSGVSFWWGAPVGLSMNFFFGNFDWHHHRVRVAQPNAYYYHRHGHAGHRGGAAAPQHWRHESQRRAAFAERRAATQPAAQAARPVVPAQLAPVVRMPAASAPRQPRAERPEQRQERREERREQRQERRQERGQKG